MIVCLRTVDVPGDVRDRYLAWIADGRAVREAHGILAELVCEPASGDGDTVVITVWPDHVAAGCLNVASLARGEEHS